MLKQESMEHYGIQYCNAFQEPFHYKEATSKRNYPSWSTSDARNCSLVNEIWTPDPALLPSQDTSPTENLIHHQLKIYFTKAEIRK